MGTQLNGLFGDVPLDRVWFFTWLCPKQGISLRVSLSRGYCLHERFDLQDKFCLSSKYTRAYNVKFALANKEGLNGVVAFTVNG